jgi:hypothetical protein
MLRLYQNSIPGKKESYLSVFPSTIRKLNVELPAEKTEVLRSHLYPSIGIISGYADPRSFTEA